MCLWGSQGQICKIRLKKQVVVFGFKLHLKIYNGILYKGNGVYSINVRGIRPFFDTASDRFQFMQSAVPGVRLVMSQHTPPLLNN